jgi:hypothetical protein
MTYRHFLPATAALLCLAFASCAEDPVTTLDRSSDCSDICKRYKDCVADSKYNADDCSGRCRDMTSDEKTKRIDSCESCLDGKSCVGSVFQCTDECAGIVP